MIRFEDGPAKGTTVNGCRYPPFLRAVQDKKTGQWDACEQPGDSPRKQEQPMVYLRVGHSKECATYRLSKRQPDEATMRDNDLWQAWCYAQQARTRTAAGNAPAPAVERAMAQPPAHAPEVRPPSPEPEV